MRIGYYRSLKVVFFILFGGFIYSFSRMHIYAPPKRTVALGEAAVIPSNKLTVKTTVTSTVTTTVTTHVSTHTTVTTAAIPTRRVVFGNISCPLLFNGDESERVRAETFSIKRLLNLRKYSEYYYLKLTCSDLQRRYIMKSMSEEEKNFPIAYSLIVYQSISQFERLLRALYRPEHYYCIHVDNNAQKAFFAAVKHITSCFPNVILAPRRVKVYWGMFTVLEADLICMEALLKFSKKWKYFINLTGQEFPLRTNLELVKILGVMNGSNLMEGTYRRRNVNRIPQSVPVEGMRWMKGSIHIVAQRGFVHYAIHDKRAIRILEVLHEESRVLDYRTGFKVPDEQFFATLNHNPVLHVPGSYLGKPETDDLHYPFLPRLKNWFNDFPCKSRKYVRGICIWGVEDLPFIRSRPELFINKFHDDFQPFALDCIEEWFWERTKSDYENSNSLSLEFYKSLDVVKNHM